MKYTLKDLYKEDSIDETVNILFLGCIYLLKLLLMLTLSVACGE